MSRESRTVIPAFLLLTGGITFIPAMVAGLLAPSLALTLAAVFVSLIFLLKMISAPGSASRFQDIILLALAVIFTPLSIVASPLPEQSMQSAAVFIWCLGAMTAAELWITRETEKTSARTVRLLAVVSITFGIIGLAGIETAVKFPVLAGFSAAVPKLHGVLGMPEGGFPANEVGGAASWLVPVWIVILIARRDKAHPRWLRALVWIAAALTVILLLVSQSRGAYLAGAAGTFLVLMLSGARGRIVAGVLLIIAIAGIAFIGVDSLVGTLTYHRRFDSFLPIFTGRDEIWARAWMLVTDLPALGIGFGTFGTVVKSVYPFRFGGAAPPVEDAHNLCIQTALDFGVAGAVVLALFLGALLIGLIRSYKSTRKEDGNRVLILGLLGSFTAYILYNTTDAVSLCSPASVMSFIVFAAARSLSLSAMKSRPQSLLRSFALFSFIIACIVITISVVRPLPDQMQISDITAAIVSNPAEIRPDRSFQQFETAPSSPYLWYYGLEAGLQAEAGVQATAWTELALRNPGYIRYMYAARPDDTTLASAVFRAVPEVPVAAFWYASTIRSANPAKAAGVYARGLVRDSADGWAWLYYGDALLASGDTATAQKAYIQACYHDDPGLNGCLRAGRTSEWLGDTLAAVSFYEISEYGPARKRAAVLRTRHGIRSETGR